MPTPSADSAAPNAAPKLDGPPGVVLERLRDRVLECVREMETLAIQNADLRRRLARIESAEQEPRVPLMSGEDPAQLRARIEGYVAVLDAYLSGDEGEDDG
jgi:hypothetical protein